MVLGDWESQSHGTGARGLALSGSINCLMIKPRYELRQQFVAQEIRGSLHAIRDLLRYGILP